MLLVLSGCTSEESLTRYQKSTTEAGFDTEMRLIAYAASEDQFNTYFDMMKEAYYHYHQLFDRFHNYDGINNIKTINDMAGIEPVEVDPVIIEMLLAAKTYYEVSPYFDITMGAVYDIWHRYREEGISLNEEGKSGERPRQEELQAAALLSGWDNVIIDESKSTVYLTLKGMMFDVGAIAKGFATEKVALKLEAEGLSYAIVSGGGNIRTINHQADGSPWKIGIQVPAYTITQDSIDVFSFASSMSVVTSGDYQRYYYVDDEEGNEIRLSHLVNPKTLEPENLFRSVTLITKDSTMADALSTAFFMMDYEEGLAFVKTFNEEHPDTPIEIVWVKDTQEGWYTSKDFAYMMTDALKPLSRNLNNQ